MRFVALTMRGGKIVEDHDSNVNVRRDAINGDCGRSRRPTKCSASQVIDGAVNDLGGTFDRKRGGFGGAPEFPSRWTSNSAAGGHGGRRQRREVVTTSLDAMASGGMYDHLGGGFARYRSTRGSCPTSRRCCTTRRCSSASTCTRYPSLRRAAVEGDRGDVEYVLREIRHPRRVLLRGRRGLAR